MQECNDHEAILPGCPEATARRCARKHCHGLASAGLEQIDDVKKWNVAALDICASRFAPHEQLFVLSCLRGDNDRSIVGHTAEGTPWTSLKPWTRY